MITKVAATITEHKLIKSGDKIVVGVSGGPDSVALLCLLQELKFDLVAAHINYQTRGHDSDKDEKFTRQLARKLEVPVFVKKVKLNKNKSGFEARARLVRYRFFDKVCLQNNAAKIAVAHNSNDLVETMLLHWLRGAGPRGLAGLAYCRGRVIRPLLDVSREEIIEYLRRRRQSFRIDKSNRDVRYRRNWVRWRLLPYLRRQVDKNIDKQLLHSARQFGDLADWLEAEAAVQLDKLRIKNGEYKIKSFLLLPSIIQGEIIRTLLGKYHITKKHVAEVLAVLQKSESGKQKSFRGIKIVKKARTFLVEKLDK
jgi:tRNA(Ile)-lysidine synthase